jgi:hypothetical protein
MGREIVYCDVCGDRILEQDFERGRAATVQNRNYCAKCRKQVFETHERAPEAASPGAPRAQAKSSPALKAAAGARPSTHRGTSHRPAKASPLPIILGGLGAAAALVIVLALALSGGARPPEPPPKAPEASREERARQAMARLDPLVRPTISDPGRVLELAGEIEAAVAGTSHEPRLKDIVAQARRRREQAEKDAEAGRLLAEARGVISADRDFAQADRVRELLAKAEVAAREAGAEREREAAEQQRRYAADFEAAARARHDEVHAEATRLAGERRWADAVKLIDDRFGGAWRRSASWAGLEALRRRCEQEAAATPPPPPPPTPAKRDRFGFPVGDAPPLDTWTSLFDGKTVSSWFKFPVARENAQAWTAADGELVGTSSYESGNEMFGDILASLHDAYTDAELQFQLKIESGVFFVGGRYLPGASGQAPRVAGHTLSGPREWSAVKLAFSGDRAQAWVDGRLDGTPDLSTAAPSGRFVLGMLGGTKVRIKDVKVLRKK